MTPEDEEGGRGRSSRPRRTRVIGMSVFSAPRDRENETIVV